MKSIMLSIRPKWCALIANGRKTIEVRKTRPKIEPPFKVYIYCTKGGEPIWTTNYNRDGYLNGKVIGEYVCDSCERYGPPFLGLSHAGCVPAPELYEYNRGGIGLYGWHISDLVIYDTPKELTDFNRPSDQCDLLTGAPNIMMRPPQSWCYVQEIQE